MANPFNIDAILLQSIVSSSNSSMKSKQSSRYVNLIEFLSRNNTNEQIYNSQSSSFSVALQTVSNEDFKYLKNLIRTTFWSIDHSIRRQLWMNISTLTRTSNRTQSSIIVNIHSTTTKSIQWPKFVDINNLCFYHLNPTTGQKILQNILSSFAIHHPDLTYCPSLEPIAALLLHYHQENQVLYILNRLLKENWLCGGTYLQWEAIAGVLEKLLRRFYKSAAELISLTFANTKIFYQDWFWWIFRYLPFAYLVKIMDCMLFEGPKVLLRISLTLVHFYTKKIEKDSRGNVQSMNEFCQEISLPIDRLLDVAFRIRNFKQRQINQLIEHEEKLLRTNRHQSTMETLQEQRTFLPQHIYQIPDKSFLNHQQFLILWNWLPARLSLAQPMLVFTTEEHGFRLQTLLNKIDELEYSILIVKTTNGEVFGGFCAGLWSERHQRTYFGFGESFLFTLIPNEKKYPWVGQISNGTVTRQNQAKREMFLFVNNEKLVIGGGNGDGLCIDQSLCEGRTTHCETFDNEPLCSQTDFSISILEMIAFDFSSS